MSDSSSAGRWSWWVAVVCAMAAIAGLAAQGAAQGVEMRAAMLASPPVAAEVGGRALVGLCLAAYVAAVGVPLVAHDVRWRRLPDAYTLPGIALVAVVAIVALVAAGAAADIARAIVGGAAVYGLGCVAAWWCGQLGWGDVKLAVLLGGAAGASGGAVLAASLVLGMLFAGVAAMGSLLRAACRTAARRRGGADGSRRPGSAGGLQRRIPMGPAMILGFWAAHIGMRVLWW